MYARVPGAQPRLSYPGLQFAQVLSSPMARYRHQDSSWSTRRPSAVGGSSHPHFPDGNKGAERPHGWRTGESDFAPRAPSHKVLLNFNWNVLTLKEWERGRVGFSGGSVVKHPPANEGDTGSVPDPGRFHMPWSN